MKHKRRKKRKSPMQPREIWQTCVSVNPTYFDASAARVDQLLSDLPERVFDAYCGLQRQRDSGDVFLFFRTRWVPRRSGIQIHRFLETPPLDYSPTVFGLTHEKEIANFDTSLGYDISWNAISEVAWGDFTQLVSKILTESLDVLLKIPRVEGNDHIVFAGDLRWISPLYRDAIDRVGTQQTDDTWQQQLNFDANIKGLK